MNNLSLPLIIEKNKLNSTSSWLILLEVKLTDGTNIFIANNNEIVTFKGNDYYPFPLQLDTAEFNSSGEIPTFNLSISNVTHVLQGYIEDLKGGVRSTVIIHLVSTEHLSEDFSSLDLEYTIMQTDCSSQAVTFALGAANPLRRAFSPYRFIRNHCNWVYKSAECGYTDYLTTCKRNYDDCVAHSNAPRYGGFMGLDSKGFRLV